MYPARARIQPETKERRSRVRFPICVDLEYVVGLRAGALVMGKGKTKNISADGVLFESDRPLSPGTPIELRIAWPAKIESTVGLRLIAYGRIIRVRGNYVSVQFSRYEFRIRTLKPGRP